MRADAIPLAVAFAVTSRVIFAESASDPIAQLRACALMERAERLECLDKLSRTIAAPAVVAPEVSSWTISETTSPVDYAPIVTATTLSPGGSDGSSMQLAIRCRGGRTELAVTGAAVSRKGEDYAISYRINDGEPVQLAAGSPSFGTGARFTGDAVRLLQSLPEAGGIVVRLSTQNGVAQEGFFSLVGLKTVREKIAAPCKWPNAVASPRN
jgi:hypothetical protein